MPVITLAKRKRVVENTEAGLANNRELVALVTLLAPDFKMARVSYPIYVNPRQKNKPGHGGICHNHFQEGVEVSKSKWFSFFVRCPNECAFHRFLKKCRVRA